MPLTKKAWRTSNASSLPLIRSGMQKKGRDPILRNENGGNSEFVWVVPSVWPEKNVDWSTQLLLKKKGLCSLFFWVVILIPLLTISLIQPGDVSRRFFRWPHPSRRHHQKRRRTSRPLWRTNAAILAQVLIRWSLTIDCMMRYRRKNFKSYHQFFRVID